MIMRKVLFAFFALCMSSLGYAQLDLDMEADFEVQSTIWCESVADNNKAACELCVDDCFDVWFADKAACVGKPPLEYQQCISAADNKHRTCTEGCKNKTGTSPYLAGRCYGTNSRTGEDCNCGPQSVLGKQIRERCVYGNCVGYWDVYDAGALT